MLHLVHDAVKWVADEFNDAFNFVVYVFDTITQALQAALNVVSNIANVAWQWVESAATTVGGWITHAIEFWWSTVILPAIAFVQTLVGYISDALSFALTLLQGTLDALVRDVIDPMFKWISEAATTVGHWISEAVEAFYRDVILPIARDVAAVLNELGQLADFVAHDVLDVVHAVQKAWGWIIWLGEHSFDELLALLEGAHGGATRDWIMGAAKDPNGWADRLSEDLAHLLA